MFLSANSGASIHVRAQPKSDLLEGVVLLRITRHQAAGPGRGRRDRGRVVFELSQSVAGTAGPMMSPTTVTVPANSN